MRKMIFIGLAAFALAPVSALAKGPEAVVGETCAQVKGVGNAGAVGRGTQHFNIRLNLTVGATGPQKLLWHESRPEGGLRVAESHFEAQSVTCELSEGGFTVRALGSARFRLGPQDVRVGAEEVVIERREGVTTVTIGTGPLGPGAPLLSLPVSRRGAAATALPGVAVQLRHNTLHPR